MQFYLPAGAQASVLGCLAKEPLFSAYLDYGRPEPFHGPEIYGNTFGSAPADLSNVIDFFQQRNDLKSGNQVLELFGGTAFESAILARKFPGNDHHSVDNSEQAFFAEPHGGIAYHKGDVFGVPYIKGLRKVDVVFVGPTNKSLCCVDTVHQLDRMAQYANGLLKKGGYFLISGFNDNTFRDTDDIQAEVQVDKLKYGKYKGLWRWWGEITHREVSTLSHYYYPMVVLSKRKEIKSGMDVEHFFYADAPYAYKSWPFFVVKEILERNGFQLEEHDLKEPNVTFMMFKKIA